jgi:hypothetical protein
MVGATIIDIPFQGGVLIPRPDTVLSGLVTDPDGSLLLEGRWPPGMPMHTDTFFQVWIADGSAPSGFATSNGLAATSP